MNGAAYVFIALGFAFAGGIVGKLKGSSFVAWFLISGVVPFLGLLTAVLMRREDEELRRVCPGCSKVVKLHDALCTRCGTELEFPDHALASEASLRRGSHAPAQPA